VERNSNRSLAFASAPGEDTRAPFKTAENRVGFVIAFAGRRCQAPMARLKIARSFNCGFGDRNISSPSGAAENFDGQSGRPCLMTFFPRISQLKLRAIFGRRFAAENNRPKSRSTKWQAGNN
jgi:hypothetical protein